MRKHFYKVNIEISNICNLQCSFCPVVIRDKQMVSTDQFKRVIEQVAPLTKVVALHLMGDPLVHPRLEELVAVVEAHDLQVFFVTNGLLLKEKEILLMLRPSFRQVSFSLHSFADNFGAKDPSEYLRRIFEFTERAFAANERLFINYRLWNLSESRSQEPSNLLLMDKIEKHFGVSLPRDLDTLTKKSYPIKNRLSLHFDTEFTWPALDLPELGTQGTCYGLSSHFGVLVDGTVVPCCLDKEGSITLGNIHKTPISAILASPRAEAMLNGFKAGKLVEDLCRRCQYIERFQQA